MNSTNANNLQINHKLLTAACGGDGWSDYQDQSNLNGFSTSNFQTIINSELANVTGGVMMVDAEGRVPYHEKKSAPHVHVKVKIGFSTPLWGGIIEGEYDSE